MAKSKKAKFAGPRFLNRELSWIEFNFRVLGEAEDKRLPPLERLNFLAITASNEDEFFMVRVGGLKMLQWAGEARPDPAGLSPNQQLKLISERMHHLLIRQYQCWNNELEPALQTAGIRRLQIGELTAPQLRHIEQLFENEIFPVLSPMALDDEEPFPLLGGLGITMYVQLAPEDAAGAARHAVLAVPKGLARFVALPAEGDGFLYVLLEDIIRQYVGRFFPGVEVLECAAFRITRNADMRVREDRAGDLLARMREVLTERKESECVRLEIERGASAAAKRFLRKALGLSQADIYEVPGPLDLSAFFRIASLSGFENLKTKAWISQASPDIPEDENMFNILQRRNVVLFHPYETYEPVIKLLQDAADDPNVLAIKQVLYRVSDKSPVVQALMRAAERGKHVTVLVELKARFDEARNIDWAVALEQVGAQVIYGVKGYKTHAKICVVVRREPSGVTRYVHFGTGNYNEKSAGIYSDVSFMTCEDDYGADASVFFNTITGYSQQAKFNKIEAAPHGLRPRLLELIENEVERHRQGEPAHIYAKMNSLVDVELIEALYKAGRAGVKIRLNVRGICCLRPGVKGLSDNISVISIVGHYLEHARIFEFRNGGTPLLFISSADWMPRNLDRRVELLVPVEDAKGREKLSYILKTCLADTQQAHHLLPDGRYERVQPDAKHHPLNSQEFFQHRAEECAEAFKQQPLPLFEPQRASKTKKK